MTVDLGEDLHLRPVLFHPWSPDEDRSQRLLPRPRSSGPPRNSELAAEGVAAAGVVGERQVVAVADDHHAQLPRIGRPAWACARTAASRPSRSRPIEIVVDSRRESPGRRDRRAVPGSGPRLPPLPGTSASFGASRSRPGWRGRQCEGGSRSNQVPRPCSRPPSEASASISSPGIASPSSIEAWATRSGSLKCVVASTIARPARRILALEDS